MDEYASLPRRAQVHRLRRFAHTVLERYPVDATAIRLLAHEYNTSFRVDTADGRRYALRINVASQRRPEWTASEMAWIAAIDAETDLHVPAPLRTRTGELLTEVASDDLGRPLTCVVFEWLPGRDLGDSATHAQMREVGRAIATLHDHAEAWHPPAGFELPRYDDPLLGTPDHVAGNDSLTADQRAVLTDALAATREHYAAMFADARAIPLHADVHQWNLKWWRGRLSIFDFDDSGIGVPLQDLAISAYYIRRVDRSLEAALHEGYASRRPLPDVASAGYEANLASRNLVLLNDVLVTSNSATRAALEHYLPNSVARLRDWLDTGTYRFEVTA